MCFCSFRRKKKTKDELTKVIESITIEAFDMAEKRVDGVSPSSEFEDDLTVDDQIKVRRTSNQIITSFDTGNATTFNLAQITGGGTFSTPGVAGVAVERDAVQTLTNKTLGGTTNIATANVTDGIFLPTSGGSPSKFDYYGNAEANSSNAWSGPTGAFNMAVEFTRHGKLCCVTWDDHNPAASAGGVFMSPVIDARFRPRRSFIQTFSRAKNNSLDITAFVIWNSSNNKFEIYKNVAQDDFDATGDAGFSEFSWTYDIS